jgi:recombination endonuclease VII
VARNRHAENLRRFGLTPDQYARTLARQGGTCAICGVSPKARRLSVDHDHQSKRKPSRLHGRLRGLLCHRCNRYRVGQNDVESARRVVDYLASTFNARSL